MRALCEDCRLEGTRKGKKIVTYLLHAGIKTELGKFVLQCSEIVEDFYNGEFAAVMKWSLGVDVVVDTEQIFLHGSVLVYDEELTAGTNGALHFG